MQHCEACGAELPNDAQFCGHCGSKATIEEEITASNDDTSIEDTSMPSSEDQAPLSDSQSSNSENEEDEQQFIPVSPSENASEEEQTSDLNLERSGDTSFDPVTDNSQAQQEHDSTLEYEDEEPSQYEQFEPASLTPAGTASEPEILTHQISDNQSQETLTPKFLQETQNSFVSSPKPKLKPVSGCLLFSIAGLIIIAGLVFTLISLHYLSGFGGSSNTLSSSSGVQILNPTGSSLTASICMNTSTPSATASNQGSTFTLSSSTGCSTVAASKADSSCLIFPYSSTSSYKYIVDVSNAAIDSSSYHLVLGIVDYTVPATYTDAKHISVGLSQGSTGRTFSWVYRSGSVTINTDQQSGSIDVILAAVSGANTLHIVGDWACGHQIKST